MVSNSAKLDHRTKQHTQFGGSASNGSRDMARTKLWRKKEKKKKNNKANCMISNSAKLASRTKQHTKSGVSTSDDSRDIAATKSWRKKRKKKEKKNEHRRNYIASPTGIANKSRNKRREGERSRERDLPGHEKDRTASEISWVQCPLLYNMPRGSPEVANLSNTIESGIKYTDFPIWPSL